MPRRIQYPSHFGPLLEGEAVFSYGWFNESSSSPQHVPQRPSINDGHTAFASPLLEGEAPAPIGWLPEYYDGIRAHDPMAKTEFVTETQLLPQDQPLGWQVQHPGPQPRDPMAPTEFVTEWQLLPEDQPLGWLPTYDLGIRAHDAPSIGEYSWLDVADDSIVDPSWQVQHPGPQPRDPMAETQFVTEHQLLPADEPIDWLVQHPGPFPAPVRSIEGEVFAPLLAGVAAINTDWFPLYPDTVARHAPIADVPSLFEPISVADEGWFGAYPNAVLGTQQWQYQAGVAPFEEGFGTPQDTNIAWLVEHFNPVAPIPSINQGPTTTEPLGLLPQDGPVSWYPTYDLGIRAHDPIPEYPSREFGPQNLLPADGPVSWLPQYDDGVRSHPPIPDYPSLFAPFKAGSAVAEVPEIPWLPQYPDTVARHPDKTDSPTTFAPIQVADEGWFGAYPNVFGVSAQFQYQVQAAPFAAGAATPDDEPLGWYQQHPGPQPAIGISQSGESVEPIGEESMEWAVPAPGMGVHIAWQYPAFAAQVIGEGAADIPTVSWLPIYGDGVRGHDPIALGEFTWVDNFDDAIDDPSWLVQHPGPSPAPRMPETQFVTEIQLLPADQPLAWLPLYDDGVRPHDPIALGSFDWVDNSDVAELFNVSWLPLYDDGVRAHDPMATTQFVTEWQVLPSDESTSWTPEYDDGIRPVEMPRLGETDWVDNSDIAELLHISWLPEYDDGVRAHDPMALGEFAWQDTKDQGDHGLAWEPEYDLGIRAHPPVPEYPSVAFVVPPAVIIWRRKGDAFRGGDVTQWGTSVYLEVWMRAFVGTRYARLYDRTTASEVIGSRLSSSSTAFEFKQSVNLLSEFVNEDKYEIHFGSVAGEDGDEMGAHITSVVGAP